MEREKKSNKKALVLVVLLLLLFFVFGYSAMSSLLKITGTSTISTSSWDVHLANVNVSSGSATATTAATISGDTVNFAVTLSEPGKFYEFTVDAVNGGSLAAKLGTAPALVVKDGGTTLGTLPKYLKATVTYSDGTTAALNDALAAGATKTYKVRVAYDTSDVTNSSELPTANKTFTYEFNMNYVQS